MGNFEEKIAEATKRELKSARYQSLQQHAAGKTGRVFYVLKTSATNYTQFVEDHPDYKSADGVVTTAAVYNTLDAAVGACTANQGDTIYVMAGHTETIASATALAIDVAGINIIGLGSGNDRPVFSLSATTSTIAVSAASVVWKNCILKATINNVAAGITVSDANCTFDLETQDTDATTEFISAFVTTTAANRLTIKAKHIGFLAGAVGTRYIDLVGAETANIDVDYFGVSSVAVVNMRTTASDNVRITGKFHNGTTNLTKDVVDTTGTSTWSAEGFDVVAGANFSGGSGAALAVDDASAIAAQLTVPSADVSTNTNERDVIGNKTDAATYTPTTTKSLMAYLKGLVNGTILATGTFTTSSATVPADTGRTEANDYWEGCVLIPLTGAIALQPRVIASFANTGGIFTLDSDRPFTAVPGLVTYIIVRGQDATVPAADSTANTMSAHAVGNKTDAAVTIPGPTTKSAIAILKGLMTGAGYVKTVALAAADMVGTTTRFTVTGPIRVKSLGLLTTTVLPAGANTLKISFTPTGGAATDLCGATDTASAANQQLFYVDGTKATGLVKTTDVGILAAGQKQTSDLVLSDGVIQTIYSAGAPASGAMTLFIGWEPLGGTASVI